MSDMSDMNIADKLQEVISSKQDIKAAIEGKGISVTGGLSSYASAIDKIGIGEFYILKGMKLSGSTFESIPSNYDFSKVTDMNSMFAGCERLETIDLSHLDNSITDMNSMFAGCSALYSIDISGYDLSKVTDISNFITKDNGSHYHHWLYYLTFGKNLKINWTGTGSPATNTQLKKESLLSIIDGLYDFKGNGGSTTRSCQFGSFNLSKLTEDEIALATAKGWTLTS